MTNFGFTVYGKAVRVLPLKQANQAMEATRSDLLPVGAQRADSGVGRVVSSQFTWTPVDWRRVFATQPWLLLLLVTCFALVPSQLYEMLKPPPDRHYSKPNGPYPGAENLEQGGALWNKGLRLARGRGQARGESEGGHHV